MIEDFITAKGCKVRCGGGTIAEAKGTTIVFTFPNDTQKVVEMGEKVSIMEYFYPYERMEVVTEKGVSVLELYKWTITPRAYVDEECGAIIKIK